MLESQAGTPIVVLDVPVAAGNAEVAFLFDWLQEAHGDKLPSLLSRYIDLWSTNVVMQHEKELSTKGNSRYGSHSFATGDGAVRYILSDDGHVLA